MFHADPVYDTVFELIPLQLVGVDGVGAVNLQVELALYGLTDVNVPLLYPLG